MKKIKKILFENYLVIFYFFITIFIELIGTYAISGKMEIKDPKMALSLLGIFTLILLLIENQQIRFYLSIFLLILQIGINLFSIILFEMTGTIFDFGMFNLRKDAMGILESVPINFTFVFWALFFFLFFALILKRFAHKIDVSKKNNYLRAIKFVLITIFLVSNVLISSNLNVVVNEDYTAKLERDNQEKYQQLGMSSNFVNEIYRGLFFNHTAKKNVTDVKAYISNGGYFSFENDNFYGISKGKNVITILGESFEWFSFIQNELLYPKGLGYDEENECFNSIDEKTLRNLFPNLYYMYDNSMVMLNNYSREKTDISEMQSILGSYPSDVYINYDYPDNDYNYSIVNLLKKNDSDICARYYHNSFGSYYNRETIMPNLGFDPINLYLEDEDGNENILSNTIVDSNIMYELGMTNAQKENLGRNLDSEMMEYTKEIMFPTDKRFYTYITTLTMHGMYAERTNLKEYYDKLDEYNILKGKTTYASYLRNYVACAMDFDKALGIMFDYLKDNNLLDNTIIVVFGDHNAYYHGLSGYVKNIKSYDKEQEEDNDYTLLYNVPLMIYDANLIPQKINKFTTTNDIVPTLMHLLGINNYKNLYFGNSILTTDESILYSRAYNVFIDSNLYFFSINDIKFKSNNVDEKYIEYFKNRAYKHLQKLEYIDQIVYYNLGKQVM